MKTTLTSLLVFALLAGQPALAQDAAHAHDGAHDAAHAADSARDVVIAGDLEISGAFTRATPPNAPVGGGYLVIANRGDADDRLIGGSTAIAGALEIHEMAVTNDVMTMRELPEGLVIPAGETVTLEPGGYHLMLMQLSAPIVEGVPVTVTLEFERAGTVEIDLAVAAPGARTAPGADHGHHAH
ncbi:copper chaperone PCu(A)C [Arsenicitalea aurantiaca]|uniref:Copper chaperone PCu(A)C n=1 Tax=Arsenicitalea aurantiaca TaxID=1783274 RepID=A0A433XKG8_9HYPH|nr:copper chaperone PCu(A)C [Arsenicitalea aurantiaca]RUT34570.1 copper chaperone PCu(A)C [Arsenicitalea aurantiaca]